MYTSFIRLCWVMGLLTIWCVPGGFQISIAEAQNASKREPSAVILMYHRFGEGSLPSTSIRLEQLDDHIAALKAGGHSVVPLADVVAALQGEGELPDKAVAITVDDAYRSFLTEGWPRFKAEGFPVTLFVATAGVDAGYADLLSWDDIRGLAAEGVTIGAHSHGHGHFPAMSAGGVADDLSQMMRSFERELGAVPELMAYPYGEAGVADMAAVEKAGFTAALGQHSGAAGPLANRFYLPRFALNESFGRAERFRLVIDTLPLPVGSIDPAEPILKDNPPILTLSLMEAPAYVAGLTCFGPDGSAIPTAVDKKGGATQVWITPETAFPTGRVRVNCTLQAQAPGLSGRWYWFGWQMISGFQSEGAAVHSRYR